MLLSAITATVGLISSGLVVVMLVAPTTRRIGRMSAEAAILLAAYLISTFLVFLHRHQQKPAIARRTGQINGTRGCRSPGCAPS